ncbi:MAG: M48 family metallopeptidase [Mariniblastus sp.]|nr:M48 family metallopeptidase [Mariniblastus sp.]
MKLIRLVSMTLFVSALAVCWLLPAGTQVVHAQLNDLFKPLRELQDRDVEPAQLLSSFLERSKYTPEELEAIERIQIPIKMEMEYGQQSVEKFRDELKRQRIKIVRRNQDVAYVQRLVDTLHPLMDRAKQYKKLQVFVVESPEVMAWAYPGGTIFVYEGLLNFAPSEAALVAVLGHELSHIDRGHQLFDLKRTQRIKQTLNPASFSMQQLMSNQQFFLKSIARPFRPEEELLADLDGARWAFQLGYDPREMAALFQRMQQRQQQKNGQNPWMGLAAMSFLQTHPASDVRFQKISLASDELIDAHPGRPLYRGIKNVRQRETRLQKEHRDEMVGQ